MGNKAGLVEEDIIDKEADIRSRKKKKKKGKYCKKAKTNIYAVDRPAAKMEEDCENLQVISPQDISEGG